MSSATITAQRQNLIRNVLLHAANNGLPVTLAACLDKPVRVRCPITDLPIWVPLRSLRADHVRCD
jgi:hypothetical protein